MRVMLMACFLGLAAVVAAQIDRLPAEHRPDLSAMGFIDQDGKKCTVADFRGKIVVIDFWTVWCPACRLALPGLAALQRDPAAGAVVEVIPCNLDEDRWPIEVKRFVSMNQSALAGFRYYRCRSGKQGVKANLGQEVKSYPTTLVIDREGRLAVRWSGYAEGLLVREINGLLDQERR